MAQSGQAGLLRTLRRARNRDADKPGRIPQPQPLSPARAAANAVGRAAERLYRLPVLPVEIKPGMATLAELPELLPDQSLLVVLQGPGDQIGVMALGFPQPQTADRRPGCDKADPPASGSSGADRPDGSHSDIPG